MRYLALLVLLTGCKATAEELAAARCDPTYDLEKCDDTLTRRAFCNPANGQWTPFAMCYLPQVCLLLAPDDNGRQLSYCKDPNTLEDATSGDKDATVPADSTVVDAKGKDAAGDSFDAKADETSGTDAAADVPDVQQGALPQQTCFQKHCPIQTLNCLKSSVCIASIASAFSCVTACGGGQGCVVQCQAAWSGDTQAFALASCGMLICAGGCGDGLCEANETPTTCPGDCKVATTGSCAGACGGKSTDCFCDQPCVGKGDCCNDYAAMCGG